MIMRLGSFSMPGSATMGNRSLKRLVLFCLVFLCGTPAAPFVVPGPRPHVTPYCRQTASRGWRRGAALDPVADTDQGLHNNNNNNNDRSFTLAIFPLRKTIKLPGEALTLNLYEDHYLALAEYVLSHNNSSSRTMVFGALYASDKPQIVTQQGFGPIVPMLQKGDVGVVFPVHEHADDMIPTRNGSGERRRIRLQGTGLARFRVESLLHNGYGGGGEQDTKQDALPFILARVKLNMDNVNDGNKFSRVNENKSANSNVNNRPLSEERKAWLSKHASRFGIDDDTVLQAEFSSFVRASTTVRDGMGKDRQRVLHTRCLQDRLSLLDQIEQR